MKEIESIAIIEDDECYGRYLKGTLLSGFDALMFSDLTSAIQHFQQNQPDVILLDLKLPDKPWPDSLSTVVAACPESAVIVITGDANDLDGTKAMEMGAQDYFSKSELRAATFQNSIVRAYQRAKRFAKIDNALKEAQLAARPSHTST